MVQKTEFAKEGYDIKVIGRNVLVTDAIKQYAVEKVSKIERFHSRIIEVLIVIDVQKLLHVVDIIVKIDHTRMKSHYAGDNMYASIDLAVDKLQRQIARYKKRLQEHHATSRHVVDMRVNVFKAPDQMNLDEVNDQIEEENQRKIEATFKPHEIATKETMPLKTLNLNEAMWQFELSGYPFMIFKSEENKKLKVIYRREEDGNLAVVELEG